MTLLPCSLVDTVRKKTSNQICLNTQVLKRSLTVFLMFWNSLLFALYFLFLYWIDLCFSKNVVFDYVKLFNNRNKCQMPFLIHHFVMLSESICNNEINAITISISTHELYIICESSLTSCGLHGNSVQSYSGCKDMVIISVHYHPVSDRSWYALWPPVLQSYLNMDSGPVLVLPEPKRTEWTFIYGSTAAQIEPIIGS